MLLFAGKTLVGSFALILSCCWAAQGSPTFESAPLSTVSDSPPLRQLKFKVMKLSCVACGLQIVQSIGGLRGVKYARVELNSPWDAEALVIFDPRSAGRRPVLNSLHKLHYYESELEEAAWRR